MKAIVIKDIKYESVDPNIEYVRIMHHSGYDKLKPISDITHDEYFNNVNIEHVRMFQYRLGNETISIGMSDEVKDILAIPLETYDDLYRRISNLEKINDTMQLKITKYVENEKEIRLYLYQLKQDLDEELNRGFFTFIKQKIKRYFNNEKEPIKQDLDNELNRGLFSFIKQKIKKYFNNERTN